MKTMKIRITLTEGMLGTACANKDVHKEFIASKSADAEKMEEELASLPAETLEHKGKLVFHRMPDGKTPMLYNYAVRGFLKEALGVQCDLLEGEVKVGKTKLSKYSFKKIVDNFVFVTPRMLPLSNPVGEDCVRPLRADTMKGERVSLATSETVPAGTTFEFELAVLAGDEKFMDVLRACLDYGMLKGLGGWRNSGRGTFVWEEVKPDEALKI